MYSTRYSCQIVTEFEIFRQIFEKYSNVKFHENSSSGGRVGPCGRADGQTDITKLTVAFRNFANAPAKQEVIRTFDILAGDIGPYSELYRVHNVHDMYVAGIK
jgi:hypothetical protein